jgi:hypothetical protein
MQALQSYNGALALCQVAPNSTQNAKTVCDKMDPMLVL